MLKIEVNKREQKSSVNKLEKVIGVVYGGEIKENILITLDYNKFAKIFSEVKTSQVFLLDIDGKEVEVMVKDFQLDPVNDRFVHVDFYAITKGHEMEVVVPFNFINESEAVKLGNILNKVHMDIKILSTPKNIPTEIKIDLSSLETVEDTIRLSDVKLGEGVRFASEDIDEVIVSVSKPDEETAEEVVSEEVKNTEK
jgi:large subunit ribosomal protein L25